MTDNTIEIDVSVTEMQPPWSTVEVVSVGVSHVGVGGAFPKETPLFDLQDKHLAQVAVERTPSYIQVHGVYHHNDDGPARSVFYDEEGNTHITDGLSYRVTDDSVTEVWSHLDDGDNDD